MKTIYKFVALIAISLMFQNCAILMQAHEDGVDISDQDAVDEYIQKSFLGLSAGFGLENELKESSFCLGLEYLHRTNDINKDVGFYAGGTLGFEYINYDNFNSNAFKVGPKVEWLIPMTPSKETQWIIGAKGTYDFGTQNFDNFKEDLSGYQASIFSGFNIIYNDKISFGLEFNLLSHINYTYKYDNGEAKFEDTQLLLNKNNPAMLYARFSLGGGNKRN